MIKSNRLRNINNIYCQKAQNFDSSHFQVLEKRKATPIQSYARNNNTKNTNPYAFKQNSKGRNFSNNQDFTAKFSTNSRTTQQKYSREKEQNEFKILTIKQITNYSKIVKQFDLNGPRIQSVQQNNPCKKRKLFVSISKRNQQSLSKQKCTQNKNKAQPRLNSIRKQNNLQAYTNSNKKIIDKVELQVQNIRTNRFLCK